MNNSNPDPLAIVGQIVSDKYRIEQMVGEGGFALIYRAQHTIWKQPVAIKFFTGLSSAPLEMREQLRQAFIQEGALLTQLSSETAGIVQARDTGAYTTPDGQWVPYMVLEWLDGCSLDEVLEKERSAGGSQWNLTQVVSLLGQIASALDVAHGKGVAHRDVKPANLFVIGGDARRPLASLKLLDFGVAKMMSANTQFKAALAKTGTTTASFTPQYGAPEQYSRAFGATGPWTDVYSLALVAIEMLTGRGALDGDDIAQLAFATTDRQRRPTPRSLGVDVSDAVEAVFVRALSVDPKERYTRAAEFWQALQFAATGVEQNGPGPFQLPHPGISKSEPPPAMRSDERQSSDRVSTMAAGSASVEPPPPSAASTSSRKNSVLIPLASAAAAVALVGFGAFAFNRGPGDSIKPGLTVEETTSPIKPQPTAQPSPPAPTCPERMALIPAGQYFQGSDEKEAMDNQKPAHQVKLDPFCMDLYEVTAGEYTACSDVGKCKRAAVEVDWPKITEQERKIYSPLCTRDDPQKANHPINCVTWDMARIFCHAQGKRLPTEAEWEYATRGPDGRVYPWGDDPPTQEHLNACGSECTAWAERNNASGFAALYDASDGFETTAPVGQFERGRSRFGPYDVVGNVWEWVSDWYGPYDDQAKVSPTGPTEGERRVIRGGGWNGAYAAWLRPAFRYAQVPDAVSHGIGFRCVESLQPQR